jgi:hypothetical protein
MTFTVMVADEASYTHAHTRAHIVGNYPAVNFQNNGIYTNTSWGNERILTIENGSGTTTIKTIIGDPGLNVWKVLEYNISGFSNISLSPNGGDTGPFYFGLGFTLNPNNLGSNQKGDTVEYYIKDVALVKTDGTKLPADDPAAILSGSITLGQM